MQCLTASGDAGRIQLATYTITQACKLPNAVGTRVHQLSCSCPVARTRWLHDPHGMALDWMRSRLLSLGRSSRVDAAAAARPHTQTGATHPRQPVFDIPTLRVDPVRHATCSSYQYRYLHGRPQHLSAPLAVHAGSATA